MNGNGTKQFERIELFCKKANIQKLLRVGKTEQRHSLGKKNKQQNKRDKS